MSFFAGTRCKEAEMRLISEKEVLDRIRAAIAEQTEDDLISRAIRVGLERAMAEVLLSNTEGRKA